MDLFTTKSTLFAVSKDEWDTKEGADTSHEEYIVLYTLWHEKSTSRAEAMSKAMLNKKNQAKLSSYACLKESVCVGVFVCLSFFLPIHFRLPVQVNMCQFNRQVEPVCKNIAKSFPQWVAWA